MWFFSLEEMLKSRAKEMVSKEISFLRVGLEQFCPLIGGKVGSVRRSKKEQIALMLDKWLPGPPAPGLNCKLHPTI